MADLKLEGLTALTCSAENSDSDLQRSCFICSQSENIHISYLDSPLVDSISRLFRLSQTSDLDLRNYLLTETVCDRCKGLLQSIHSKMEEMDILIQEINDSQRVIVEWIRESQKILPLTPEKQFQTRAVLRERIITTAADGGYLHSKPKPTTSENSRCQSKSKLSDPATGAVTSYETLEKCDGKKKANMAPLSPSTTIDFIPAPTPSKGPDPTTIISKQPTVSLRRMPVIERFLKLAKMASAVLPISQRPQTARRTHSQTTALARAKSKIRPADIVHIKQEPVPFVEEQIETTEPMDFELDVGAWSGKLTRGTERGSNYGKTYFEFAPDNDEDDTEDADGDEDFNPGIATTLDSPEMSAQESDEDDDEDEEMDPEPELPPGTLMYGTSFPELAKGQYCCRICGKPFNTKHCANGHVLQHSLKRHHKCKVKGCPAAYTTAKSLRRHVSDFHDNPKRVGMMYRPLKRPIPIDAPPQSKRNKKKKKNASAEFKDEGPKPILMCEQCPATFNLRHKFLAHLDSHKPSSERKLVCEQCGFGCYARHVMRRHKRRVHDPEFKLQRSVRERRQCQDCGLIVRDLSHHRTTHTDRKPHECTYCEQTFRRKGALEIHLRVHTGVRPFACDQCEASFKTSNGLKRHVFIHSDERPFVCDQCGKSFRFKSSLSEHLHIHGSDKPFRCNSCGKRFKEQHELRQHSEMDHGPEAERKKRKRDSSYRERINKKKPHRESSSVLPMPIKQIVKSEHHIQIVQVPTTTTFQTLVPF